MTEQTATRPNLPSWAEWVNGQAVVDMETVFPRYLGQLDLKPTRFGVGVVKFCVTRDLADMTQLEGLQVRFTGTAAWRDENLSAKQGSHDDGMRKGGMYRNRLIAKRAAQALAAE